MRRALAILLLWLLTGTTVHAQTDDPVTILLLNINDARLDEGLAPYALNAQLSDAAAGHSQYMADLSFTLDAQGEGIDDAITHTEGDGSRPFDRVLAEGYPAGSAGENIYAGISGPEAAFEWWMNSTAHRNNILNVYFTEIGIGTAQGPHDIVMYTLVFAYREGQPGTPPPTDAAAAALARSTQTQPAPGDGKPETTIADATQQPILTDPTNTAVEVNPQHVDTPRDVARRGVAWIITVSALGCLTVGGIASLLAVRYAGRANRKENLR